MAQIVCKLSDAENDALNEYREATEQDTGYKISVSAVIRKFVLAGICEAGFEPAEEEEKPAKVKKAAPKKKAAAKKAAAPAETEQAQA